MVTNDKIHRDLKLTTIQEEISRAVTSYPLRIQNHPNPLVSGLMNSDNTGSNGKKTSEFKII